MQWQFPVSSGPASPLQPPPSSVAFAQPQTFGLGAVALQASSLPRIGKGQWQARADAGPAVGLATVPAVVTSRCSLP